MPGLSDGPPNEVYVAVGLIHFESALARLGGRGHVVPELAAYKRGTRAAPVPWRGACTRCGASAEVLVLPPLPRKRWTPKTGDPCNERAPGGRRPRSVESRLDQAAPRKPAILDVRLLVPCRGATGEEGPPSDRPGRPYRGL